MLLYFCYLLLLWFFFCLNNLTKISLLKKNKISFNFKFCYCCRSRRWVKRLLLLSLVYRFLLLFFTFILFFFFCLCCYRRCLPWSWQHDNPNLENFFLLYCYCCLFYSFWLLSFSTTRSSCCCDVTFMNSTSTNIFS